jgi:hypothetical protein
VKNEVIVSAQIPLAVARRLRADARRHWRGLRCHRSAWLPSNMDVDGAMMVTEEIFCNPYANGCRNPS